MESEYRDKLKKHKVKWDGLAEKNDRYFVRSVDHEQSDEEYEESGRRNVGEFIEDDKLIRDKFPLLSDKVVLEIGCGSGRITRTLARLFRHVVAIDISAIMLEKAEQFVSSDNVTFIESDGASVPAMPETIDLAFSYIVYQHFPSTEAIAQSFQGVWRALRPGGLFKVQIRGEKHPDPKHWSWGPHYNQKEAEKLVEDTHFRTLRTFGEGTRSYWLLLEKPNL